MRFGNQASIYLVTHPLKHLNIAVYKLPKLRNYYSGLLSSVIVLGVKNADWLCGIFWCVQIKA